MGRPRKYATEEERREAHKTSSREWARRNQASNAVLSAAWRKAHLERASEHARRAYWKAHGGDSGFTGFVREAAKSLTEHRAICAERARQRRASNPALRERQRLQAQKHYQQNREAVRERARARHRAAHDRALAAYGGKCARCGFDDVRALHFDHVAGDGWKDRKDRATNTATYWRIVAEQVGSGTYQLLCANCNWIKAHESGEYRHVATRSRVA